MTVSARELHAKASAILSIAGNAETRSIVVRFRNEQNQLYLIEFPEGLAGGLIVGLTSMARQLALKTDQQESSGQPMTLDSGRPFRLPDGRVGLELKLDGAVRLPVLFPPEAILVLRRALDILERQSGGHDPGKRSVN